MPASKRRHLLVLSLYLVLSLAATWPLVRQLGSAIPGDSFDGWQNVWNLWWMRKSWLVRHVSPYFAPILHHPTGADLRFQTMAPFNGLVTLPIQLVFGLLPAYNKAVLSSFVIGGFGAYLLARYALRGIYERASKPSAISHSAFPHFRIHHSSFIVFSILLRLHRRPGLCLLPLPLRPPAGPPATHRPAVDPFLRPVLAARADRSTPSALRLPHSALSTQHSALLDGLKAGLFLILVGLCDWYYVMYCLLFTGLALLIWLIKRQLTWRGVGVVATAGALFGVVLAPLLLPMIQATRTWVNASLVRDPGETVTFSADLLGFVTPQVFHPLWGDWALNRSAAFSATPSEYTVFAGFTVLLLPA